MKRLLKHVACQPFHDPVLILVHQLVTHRIDASGRPCEILDLRISVPAESELASQGAERPSRSTADHQEPDRRRGARDGRTTTSVLPLFLMRVSLVSAKRRRFSRTNRSNAKHSQSAFELTSGPQRPARKLEALINFSARSLHKGIRDCP